MDEGVSVDDYSTLNRNFRAFEIGLRQISSAVLIDHHAGHGTNNTLRGEFSMSKALVMGITMVAGGIMARNDVAA